MFRSIGKSKIAFVLALLFGVSLFFFKGGSRYSNFFNSDSIVANVSGTSISTTKFNRTMRININKFNQMMGQSLSGDEIRGFNIHSMALRALINDALFENEYDEINFRLDEKIIAQKTRERIPKLYDSNNKLDEIYLSSFLQEQGLKIEDIVQIIKYETRDNFFSDAFFKIDYPKYFTDKIKSIENHKRIISYLELPLNKVQTKAYNENNLLDLNNFYDENIKNYMSDEKRNIEFIVIDKNILKNNFIPTNNEIEKYYNQNKALFYESEKRSFIQFNFKNTDEALSFKNKVKDLNLEKLIDYAKNKNLRFNEFVDLKNDEILKEIAEPLFNLDLKTKPQSEIITSTLAKHILILKSIKPAIQLSLAEVKKEISNNIQKNKTNILYEDLSNQISEKIINGENIDDIAITLNLSKEFIKDMNREYQEFDKSKEDIYSQLIISGFNANKDFISDVININENKSLIFNVTDITLSQPLKFEDIKSILINDWEKTNKINKIKLDTQKNINNNMYLSNLAKKYAVTIKEENISKNDTKIPTSIIKDIFQSNKDDNIQVLFDNIFYIINTKDIILSEASDNSTISLNNDLRNSFGEEIMKNKKISINDNLVSAIIDQY